MQQETNDQEMPDNNLRSGEVKETAVSYYSPMRRKEIQIGRIVALTDATGRISYTAYDHRGKYIAQGDDKKYFRDIWIIIAMENESRVIRLTEQRQKRNKDSNKSIER